MSKATRFGIIPSYLYLMFSLGRMSLTFDPENEVTGLQDTDYKSIFECSRLYKNGSPVQIQISSKNDLDDDTAHIDIIALKDGDSKDIQPFQLELLFSNEHNRPIYKPRSVLPDQNSMFENIDQISQIKHTRQQEEKDKNIENIKNNKDSKIEQSLIPVQEKIKLCPVEIKYKNIQCEDKIRSIVAESILKMCFLTSYFREFVENCKEDVHTILLNSFKKFKSDSIEENFKIPYLTEIQSVESYTHSPHPKEHVLEMSNNANILYKYTIRFFNFIVTRLIFETNQYPQVNINFYLKCKTCNKFNRQKSRNILNITSALDKNLIDIIKEEYMCSADKRDFNSELHSADCRRYEKKPYIETGPIFALSLRLLKDSEFAKLNDDLVISGRKYNMVGFIYFDEDESEVRFKIISNDILKRLTMDNEDKLEDVKIDSGVYFILYQMSGPD